MRLDAPSEFTSSSAVPVLLTCHAVRPCGKSDVGISAAKAPRGEDLAVTCFESDVLYVEDVADDAVAYKCSSVAELGSMGTGGTRNSVCEEAR